jgi:hypothetical protein
MSLSSSFLQTHSFTETVQPEYSPANPGDTEFRPGRMLQLRPLLLPGSYTRPYDVAENNTRGLMLSSQQNVVHEFLLPR